MPQHRKPADVLELSGAFEKNPQRRRAADPVPFEPIGDPPAALKRKAELEAWREIVKVAPPGILSRRSSGLQLWIAVPP